jgi:ferredoxin
MGIDPKTGFNSVECIRCGRCAASCPSSSLHMTVFGISGKKEKTLSRGKESED